MADANSMTRSEAIAALTKSGERYELQELEINGGPVRVFKNAPSSLRALYEETRAVPPESPHTRLILGFLAPVRTFRLYAKREGNTRMDPT